METFIYFMSYVDDYYEFNTPTLYVSSNFIISKFVLNFDKTNSIT
jgi:hypothetical protein